MMAAGKSPQINENRGGGLTNDADSSYMIFRACCDFSPPVNRTGARSS